MGNKEILANYNLGHLVTKLTAATAMSPPGSRQLTRLRVAGEKHAASGLIPPRLSDLGGDADPLE